MGLLELKKKEMKKITQKPLRGKEREVVISTLKKIADENGLSSVDKSRFVKFAINWYNLNGRKLWTDIGYAFSWADRFQRNKEYGLSDYDRLGLLVKVDGLKNAQTRLAKQVGEYYPGYPLSHPRNEAARQKAKDTLRLALAKA